MLNKKILGMNQGFTLVELIVTISIGVILTSIILLDYGKFNDNLALTSAMQEMAINIRQAQTYGINVKETSIGSGQFSAAYGIYFNPTDSPSDYYIFADLNGNKKYDDAVGACGGIECIEKISMRSGVTFHPEVINTVCVPISSVESAHITFLRPSSDANINLVNNGGSITCTDQPDTQITLCSLKKTKITINIDKTGQIQTESTLTPTANCP